MAFVDLSSICLMPSSSNFFRFPEEGEINVSFLTGYTRI